MSESKLDSESAEKLYDWTFRFGTFKCVYIPNVKWRIGLEDGDALDDFYSLCKCACDSANGEPESNECPYYTEILMHLYSKETKDEK